MPQAQPVATPQQQMAAPQQMPGYPGQQLLPQQQPMVYQQPRPQVHVVHAAPYYGGYGYGYDPFLAGTMGFMGGMLIADAMFW